MSPGLRMVRPYSPIHMGRLELTLSGNLVSRKKDLRGALFEERRAFSVTWLLFLRGFPSLRFFQRSTEDIAK